VDRTDITLCILLLGNSRIPYQELANKLGLSVNAIHKRMKALTDAGIIRAFTARLSLLVLKVVTIWIFGRSTASSSDLHLRLRKHKSTYWVAYSGGGYVYVGGYLPEISELEKGYQTACCDYAENPD
jgi:DNA-binding Lrp family transcriptional regulator